MLSDPSPSKPHAPIDDKIADEGRFLRSWFEDPLRVGAVSPSGRPLARMMARYVDPQAPGPVIELGPGTGSMTRALFTLPWNVDLAQATPLLIYAGPLLAFELIAFVVASRRFTVRWRVPLEARAAGYSVLAYLAIFLAPAPQSFIYFKF